MEAATQTGRAVPWLMLSGRSLLERSQHSLAFTFRSSVSSRVQSFFPVTPATLLIRVRDSSRTTGAALRQAVSDVDSDVMVSSVATVRDLLEGPRAQPRLNAMVVVLFAVAALSLAAVGLFSVMATLVRRRTRGLGIRMALGATRGDVGRLLVKRGFVIALGGTVAGIAAARATGSLLSGLLFEVKATDVPTLVGVVGLVLTVATLASLIPARIGARIEPVTALRVETECHTRTRAKA